MSQGPLPFAQLLQATPTPNRAVRRERRQKDLVVYLPLRRRWFNAPPFSWLLPFRTEKAVGLDHLGTEVYEACDGRTAVQAIIEDFALRHKLTFHEARVSVCAFLQQLTSRRLIVMVGPNRQEPRG
ncbi:MAG: PqqD family protein [Phycisphaeraceae bacterium]|nr:PqqD family protein [Phycisphaeraceae bacterium]